MPIRRELHRKCRYRNSLGVGKIIMRLFPRIIAGKIVLSRSLRKLIVNLISDTEGFVQTLNLS